MKLVRGSDVVLFVTADARDSSLRQILGTRMSVAVRRLRRYESALDVIVGSLECDSEVPLSVWLPWRRPQPAEPVGRRLYIHILHSMLWHNTILFRYRSPKRIINVY